MDSSSPHDLVLSKLEEGIPGITQAWGQFLAEASAVCFDCNKHVAGVELRVQGISPMTFRVIWENEITEQVRNAWDDPKDVTEFGACGIAILLILELTEFTVVRKARTSTGVDYWLAHKDTSLPFQDAARLEVSGILQGDNNAVRSRINKKKKQTQPTDRSGLPAYVVVVEFSSPVAQMVQK